MSERKVFSCTCWAVLTDTDSDCYADEVLAIAAQTGSLRSDHNTDVPASAPLPPSDSWTELTYSFSSNAWLRELYRLGSPDAEPPQRCIDWLLG